MEVLQQFTIPIIGLGDGEHQFDYVLKDDFFSHFEKSPIQNANFKVNFILDKRADMLLLTLDFKGSVKTQCDRCLAPIDLPVIATEYLIIKYADEAVDGEDVVYIERGTAELNVAKYIYEYVCLAKPVTHIYNCEDEPENVCDLKTLDFLEKASNNNNEDDAPSSSPWDELKKLKNNN